MSLENRINELEQKIQKIEQDIITALASLNSQIKDGLLVSIPNKCEHDKPQKILIRGNLKNDECEGCMNKLNN